MVRVLLKNLTVLLNSIKNIKNREVTIKGIDILENTKLIFNPG